MNETPRPLNLGEILDRTVSLYRSRFLALFGISAIPTSVLLVIASGVFFFLVWWSSNGAASEPRAVARALAVGFVVAVAALALPVILAVTALAAAATNHAVNSLYCGETITIRSAYKATWARGWQYIWLYLLQALAIWGVPVGAWVGLVTLSAGLAVLGRNAGISAFPLVALFTVLVIVALAGYCIWMLLRLSLAFPACVVERISPWAALRRSTALSSGTRGRIFLLYLLGAVLAWLLSGGLALIVTVVMALLPGANNPRRAQAMGMIVLFVYYGAGFAVQAFTKPVYGIALILFYYDQRIRQEGFDIEWMMQRAGLVAPEPAAPLPVAVEIQLTPPAMAPSEPEAQAVQPELFAVPNEPQPVNEETR
jgi:hypothetical protein